MVNVGTMLGWVFSLLNKRNVLFATNLDGLVGVDDDGDEDAEHDVDEEADEEVEVDAAVPPHVAPSVADDRECDEHVVAVHQREHRLRRR